MKSARFIFPFFFTAVLLSACSYPESERILPLEDGWQYSWEAPSFYAGKNRNDTQLKQKTGTLQESSREIWQSYDFSPNPPGRNDHNILWLRTRIPEISFPDPAVLLFFVFLDFQAFLDGTMIYSSGKETADGAIEFGGSPFYIFQLPGDPAGKYIYLRIYSNFTRIGPVKGIRIGSRFDLLLDRFRDGIDELIIGALTSLIGLISLFIGFTRRRQIKKFMFAFPLFALGTGLWMISASELFVFLTGMPVLFFILSAFFQAVWIISLLLFHRQMLGSGPFGIINWIIYFSAIFMGINLIFLNVNQFQPQDNLYFGIMNMTSYFILLSIILTLPFHALYRALSGDREAQILTLSIAILASFGLREILGDLDIISREKIYYHYGVLIFIFLLGYMYNRRIVQTAEELIQKRLALTLAERDLEKSQLKLLQNRMNPHFLFNSLSALHALIEQNQGEKARETAVILTDHYRFLTDQSSESLIPLHQELEFCENFLKMQKIRFGESFSYTLETGGPLSSVLIPPLSIQPLIENSIKHGLRRRSGPGQIDINIQPCDDGCRIEVADNGDSLKTKDPYERSLGNIQKRLRHFYNTADLTIINRDPGPGVTVTIEFKNFRKEYQTEL